jgi:hypothetical protein
MSDAPADLSAFEKIRLEEYKALRSESLALARSLNTTVWAGTGAFIVTVAVSVLAAGQPNIGLVVLALCALSGVGTVLYLGQLLKYVRIGVYIRSRIEAAFSATYVSPPLFWEHWIASAKTRTIYLVSLLVLLLPPLCITLLIPISFIARNVDLSGPFADTVRSSSVSSVVRAMYFDPVIAFAIKSVSLLVVAIAGLLGSRIAHIERTAESLEVSAMSLTGHEAWPSLSVVIPVLNDGRVWRTIATLRRLRAAAGSGIQIIVCGESKAIMPADVTFCYVARAPKGACWRAGVEASSHQVVLLCDADLPVTLQDVHQLVIGCATHDVAWGHRALPESGHLLPASTLRRLGSWFFRRLIWRLFPTLVGWDTQCGTKAFRLDVARRLAASGRVSNLAFDVELALLAQQLGADVAQVPVRWQHSARSRVNLWLDGVRMIRTLVKLRRETGLRPPAARAEKKPAAD